MTQPKSRDRLEQALDRIADPTLYHSVSPCSRRTLRGKARAAATAWKERNRKKNLAKLRAYAADKRNKWRDENPAEIESILAMIEPMMRRLGYVDGELAGSPVSNA